MFENKEKVVKLHIEFDDEEILKHGKVKKCSFQKKVNSDRRRGDRYQSTCACFASLVRGVRIPPDVRQVNVEYDDMGWGLEVTVETPENTYLFLFTFVFRKGGVAKGKIGM